MVEGSALHKVAVLSMHTSPLIQPGSGDGGGMNVYVRELVSALAQAGLSCRVYVRRWETELPDVVTVEPGFDVVHISAGPPDLPKEALEGCVEEFTAGVRRDIARHGGDVIHANYWLSAMAGLQLKQQLGLPLITTFHTLARVKADGGDPEPEHRARAEARIMACADTILANCTAEAEQLVDYYDADRDRIEIIPPGVDHAFFSPGNRRGARRAIGADSDRPMLLFVGRIQPLKGLDVAVDALARLPRPDAELWVVGGASGAEGEAEVARVQARIAQHGLEDRVIFRPPQPHHLLSTYYRAADACLVPSRSESFGFVALEAAACGTPVVASAVGGLLTLVDDGHTGFLVEDRGAEGFASRVQQLLDDPQLAARMSVAATARARTYTWSISAARLRRMYADAVMGTLSRCD